jgi:hypothetical protein
MEVHGTLKNLNFSVCGRNHLTFEPTKNATESNRSVNSLNSLRSETSAGQSVELLDYQSFCGGVVMRSSQPIETRVEYLLSISMFEEFLAIRSGQARDNHPGVLVGN